MSQAVCGWTIFLLCTVLLLVGCGAKEPEQALEGTEVLAVAPFKQPRHNWELLAGHAASGEEVSPSILQELDQLLGAKLQEAGRQNYLTPAQVQECTLQVISSVEERNNLSALRFWSQVGECLDADYLLLPHLLNWGERQGGQWGVEEPARVHFDLYLLDVQEQKLLNRFKFDEQQKALSQDLLQLGRFFRRGGKWVSARELAGEGMQQAIQEWGL
ncbi:MAG: hypothetical protein ACLFRL_05230 [Desulfohalobiaceae bacterium]